jgi:hypothetical protein
MGLPRTTHPWLQPFYDALDGSGTRQVQLGSSTGTVGLYGATGIAGRLSTGTAGITGITGAGNMTDFSMVWISGGTGNFYRLDDIVIALKNCGILKP